MTATPADPLPPDKVEGEASDTTPNDKTDSWWTRWLARRATRKV